MSALKKPANLKLKRRSSGVPQEKQDSKKPALAEEFGGQPGPEPTRFGDWEFKGRCTDF